MSYHCDLCDEKFYTLNSFKRHKESCICMCDCGFKAKTKNALIAHQEQFKFKCECGRHFKTKNDLKIHISQFTFKCSRCSTMLQWADHIDKNMNKSNGVCASNWKDRCRVCKICDIYTRDFDNHQHVQKCNICHKEYIASPLDPDHRCTKACEICGGDAMYCRGILTNHAHQKCEGCKKYFESETFKNHKCYNPCSNCGEILCFLRGLRLQHKCDPVAIRLLKLEREMNSIKSDVENIKVMITETVNILKYGPLSQIAIETVERCENSSKTEGESKSEEKSESESKCEAKNKN